MHGQVDTHVHCTLVTPKGAELAIWLMLPLVHNLPHTHGVVMFMRAHLLTVTHGISRAPAPPHPM